MELTQRRKITQARNFKILQIKDTLKDFSIIRRNTLKVNKKQQIQEEDQKSQNSETTKNSSQNSMKSTFKTQNIQFFQDKYTIQKKIGEGANGFVNICKKKKNGKLYAVKSLMIDQEQIVELKKNFLDVKQLKHPNITQYHALYLDMSKKLCYLVMEYVHYPNLSQIQIKNQRQLKEIIHQLLKTIQYMHSKHFCHRDIKLQNVLYDPETKRLKLIDFGTSKKYVRRNKTFQMLTITGTMIYRAPQMFIGSGHTQKVDIWSTGILIYKLITGNFPFQSNYHSDTVKNILQMELKFDHPNWNNYEHSLKHLVMRMLKKCKDERLSATQCLRDSWFYSIKQNKSIEISHSFKQIELSNDTLDNTFKVARQPLQQQISRDQIQNHIYKSEEGLEYHLMQDGEDQILQNMQQKIEKLNVRRLKKRLSGPVKL